MEPFGLGDIGRGVHAQANAFFDSSNTGFLLKNLKKNFLASRESSLFLFKLKIMNNTIFSFKTNKFKPYAEKYVLRM